MLTNSVDHWDLVRPLDNSASNFLNGGFTFIQTHASSYLFFTLFHSFFFFFLLLFIFHILQSHPFALLLFYFFQNPKISKSPNPNLPQLPFPHLSSIFGRPLFHHCSKVGPKCKGKESIRKDSPPRFDHSSYPS